ncbi:MAG: hypothetical protein JSV12_04190 [Candidatus Bathyarchaeota archaeon]|nr:MAG: hypothetical protein JSV12_04190 [Candidatus Bathyarchaeota archaeon]
MSRKNSRFEALVKEEEWLTIEEIEKEFGKMRNEDVCMWCGNELEYEEEHGYYCSNSNCLVRDI